MLEELKKLKPDFIIVVAFGQILSKEILETPIYGCINLHASLLPLFRGAAPINWAIIRGEKTSGNTTMLMDVGLDTGDILLSEEIPIGSDMNAGELHDVLMKSGPALILKTLKWYLDNTIVPIKQRDEISIYAPTLNKDNTKINWNTSAEDIHNLIRGLSPYPTSYTLYEGNLMKVFSSSISNEKANNTPGEIKSVSNDGILVSSKDYFINITKIQFPGGRPLEVSEYIKGHKIEVGKVLG
jgi:methionyl-tRNA formyltransferase